jgi:hypothetical protein
LRPWALGLSSGVTLHERPRLPSFSTRCLRPIRLPFLSGRETQTHQCSLQSTSSPSSWSWRMPTRASPWLSWRRLRIVTRMMLIRWGRMMRAHPGRQHMLGLQGCIRDYPLQELQIQHPRPRVLGWQARLTALLDPCGLLHGSLWGPLHTHPQRHVGSLFGQGHRRNREGYQYVVSRGLPTLQQMPGLGCACPLQGRLVPSSDLASPPTVGSLPAVGSGQWAEGTD